MTQTKTIILIFATVMLMCVPTTNAFTPAEDVMLFYVTDSGIQYGSGTGFSQLNTIDNSPDTFIEEKHVSTRDEFIAHIYAEDDLEKWNISGDMSNLVLNGSAADGVYSIKSTLAGSGTGQMQYQNGTAFAWNLDATYADTINFSVRASSANAIILNQVRTHLTADDYGYIDLNQYIPTSWLAVEFAAADVEFHGDVHIGDPINWLEWDFTNAKTSARGIYLDAGMLHSPPAGALHRHFSSWFNITDMGAFDNYVVNITAKRVSLGNPSCDALYSDNATEWNTNSSAVTISNDAENAQVGSHAIRVDYKANESASVWWDNATSKSAGLNLSEYRLVCFTLWGNRSTELAGLKLFTDNSNYFWVDLAVTYGTEPENFTVPISAMSLTGSPDLGNINWIETSANHTAVSEPTAFYLDNFWFSTGDVFRFRNHNEDYFDVFCCLGYATGTITLDADIVAVDGFAVIKLNDTLRIDDAFNTTIYIDALFITAWNNPTGGAAPAEPVVPVPTTPTITPEAWVFPVQYCWLIGLGAAGIIGVVVVAKVGMYRLDDTFGGFMGYISDTLMDAYDKLREVFG